MARRRRIAARRPPPAAAAAAPRYAPFESGQLAGSSDVYKHEMPGGQYTNLLFQSKQLGLAGE